GGSGFEAGSQMKIFALAEFIDQGFSPESYYEAPFTIEYPQDADGKCARWNVRGGVSNNKARATHRTVYQATASSLNTVFAQMMFDIGAMQMADTARSLGIESEMLDCPSLVLGPNPVSPMEMAGAFGNIAREGVRVDPFLIERIEDADGNVLCWYPTDTCEGGSASGPDGEQVLDPVVARQVIGAMEGVVSGGTGRAARLIQADETVRPAAGKTGTTQRNQHAWFTGFTCGLTTSVWVGYPGQVGEPTRFMNDAANVENGLEVPTMAELFGTDEYNNSSGNGDITGGEIPAELWHDFTMGALSTLPPCETLPTERPSESQNVFGLELLTTLLHCAEPDPSVTTTDTTNPDDTTTTTMPGDSTTSTDTTSTDTTATTQPPSTESSTTTAAPPPSSTETTQADEAPVDGGGDEEAIGAFGFVPVNY
ncbi:MAG: penicillin-binding transpeptidase domain-containing protein, partial [Actinomycetota bacterium]